MDDLSMSYVVPLVMFMLMLVTGSYRKSFTNAVSITSLMIAGYIYQFSHIGAFYIMAASIFIMQIRAIINHRHDSFLKR